MSGYMAKIRVNVLPPDTDNVNYHVHLPTYLMIAGTEEYSDPEKTKLKSVIVEVPDDECTEGKPDKDKIRAKYRGQPRWDREGVLSDV